MNLSRGFRGSGCGPGMLLAAATSLMLSGGCAEIDRSGQAVAEVQSVDTQECADWFTKLDEFTDRAEVRDAEAHRIAGFPYLRVNRYLASFGQQAQRDPGAFAAWEKHLRELDARARGYEIKNLPQHQLVGLGAGGRSEALARTERCATALAASDAATPSRRRMIVERSIVPDDYADWKRTVGGYPAVSVAFFEFAKGWQSESEVMFQRMEDGNVEPGKFTRYEPPNSAVPAQRVAAIMAAAKSDAIGIPQIGDRDRETLLATFAPVFEIETTGDYDRFGPLQWRGGETPEVNISRPTAYRRIAYTRHGGRTLVQLVYMLWFPERPAKNALDPVSGKLDGIVFRVTLDQAGRPLVYDSFISAAAITCFSRLRASRRFRRRIPRSSGHSSRARCRPSRRPSACSCG